MIIRTIARLGNAGLVGAEGVPVTILETQACEGTVTPREVCRIELPKAMLATSANIDRGNAGPNSWKPLFENKREQGIFTAKLCSENGSNLPGLIKAAFYFAGSEKFYRWVQSKPDIDLEDFGRRRGAIMAAAAIWNGKMTGKLKCDWALVIVAASKNGHVVFGLSPDAPDFEAGSVDVRLSKDLAGMHTYPPATGEGFNIGGDVQAGSGLGKNPFGIKFNVGTDEIAEDEWARLYGMTEPVDPAVFKAQKNVVPRYRIKVGSNPDASFLLFFPRQSTEAAWSNLRIAIQKKNERREVYFKAKQQKLTLTDEMLKVPLPELLPINRTARVFLCNTEGKNQPKMIVEAVYPELPVRYWMLMDEELSGETYALITGFGLVARAAIEKAGKKTPPSGFALWTKVYTCALAQQPINSIWFWNWLGAYNRALSTNQLREGSGRVYLRLIPKLRRIQCLIRLSRESNFCVIGFDEISKQLLAAESRTNKGSSLMQETTSLKVDAEAYMGDLWNHLQDWQKKKLKEIASAVDGGVPAGEFRHYIRGAAAGLILHDLEWAFNKAKRSFSATMGMQPSHMRGKALLKAFLHAASLSRNMPSDFRVRFSFLPHLEGMREESLKDSFNSGFIAGLTYWSPSEGEEKANTRTN
jgi:hypothetical protein